MVDLSLSTETTLPLLPLSSGVVLPGMSVTIGLETPEARAAADAAESAGGQLLLVPKIGSRYAAVGTVSQVEGRRRLRGGLEALVVTGLARARIGSGVPGTGSALWVTVEPLADPPATSERVEELAREYRAVVENIVDQRGAGELAAMLRAITEPGALADTAGWSPDLGFEQKVELLETIDVENRLERALSWMKDVLADLSLRERIRKDVAEGMERSQREFLLRQQLDAIRRELGEDPGEADLLDDYRRRAREAGLIGEGAPDEVAKALEREIGRLERTSEQSPEHGWIRTYLDTVLELPWNVRTEEHLDVDAARDTLDSDHNGLEDVKDRIVEFLAVRKLRAERGLDAVPREGGRGQGAILALVGPPGVGKTSLGESVARALGRKFARVALGGTHDEAEIRGHRRTYVGAQPGRIVRALREAGSMNPVFVLDEVDKVGADWRGDPASALLEVLDPAQNHHFRDRYLEIELDLSDVLFIATANVIETIPAPLLDRMEVIRVDGYTDEEKVAIGRDHLLPRQLAFQGLKDDEVTVSDDALRRVISDYTREAGVRGLERELGKLLRKVAVTVAVSTPSGAASGSAVSVGVDDVPGLLGRQKFFFEPAERTAVPGVATGLAVTGVGGDVLFVEATSMEGEPGLQVTGQLGDVMKESAEIALSYVRSHAGELGIEPGAFQRRFHLHVPAGAVPKDGPSAGVTMVSALVSLLTGRPVRSEVGMTGEVTLQGRVLPIGGVKQKVLAAHRAGLREVVLPARNIGDLDDVPEAVRSDMTFHSAEEVGDVLGAALDGGGHPGPSDHARRVPAGTPAPPA